MVTGNRGAPLGEVAIEVRILDARQRAQHAEDVAAFGRDARDVVAGQRRASRAVRDLDGGDLRRDRDGFRHAADLQGQFAEVTHFRRQQRDVGDFQGAEAGELHGQGIAARIQRGEAEESRFVARDRANVRRRRFRDIDGGARNGGAGSIHYRAGDRSRRALCERGAGKGEADEGKHEGESPTSDPEGVTILTLP